VQADPGLPKASRSSFRALHSSCLPLGCGSLQATAHVLFFVCVGWNLGRGVPGNRRPPSILLLSKLQSAIREVVGANQEMCSLRFPLLIPNRSQPRYCSSSSRRREQLSFDSTYGPGQSQMRSHHQGERTTRGAARFREPQHLATRIP